MSMSERVSLYHHRQHIRTHVAETTDRVVRGITLPQAHIAPANVTQKARKNAFAIPGESTFIPVPACVSGSHRLF